MSASAGRARSVSTPRILVVGGGIIGLSVAFALMRRGAAVRILDAGSPGAGASKAAAGMLPPGLEAFGIDGAHPDLAGLLFAARAKWPDFAAQLAEDGGEDGLGCRVIGTLATATDAAGQERLEALSRAAIAVGERVDLLGGGGARKLAPGLSAAVGGALYFPDDALVEPPLAIAALTRALVKGGAQIRAGLKAIEIAQTKDCVTLRLENGDVEHADAIVIAPGWGDIKLAPELTSIFPVKGQILTVSGGKFAPEQMLRGEGIYLAPRRDGRVEIGATNEPGIQNLDIEPDAIIALHRAAARLFPALASAQVLASRAGIRPGSPDHAPLLGVSSLGSRVFLAAGLHRNGVLLAPLVADLLADAVLGESRDARSQSWLTAFGAMRFASL